MPDNKSPKMTTIGDTGITIPSICFGTSALGDMPNTYGYSVDQERATETVRAIFESPAKFLDCARNYGMGRSEERVGLAIRELGGLPPDCIVSTKLDRDMENRGFDAAQARRSLEQSLEALNLDRVQLLHLHDPEHAASVAEITGPGGALPELFKMKEEGLADAIGLAAGAVDVMMPILRDWDFDVLITHSRYTLTNVNAEAMIDFARSRGIVVLNAAPFAGGVLAKGSANFDRYVYQEATDEMLAPVRQVESICSRYEIPLGAAALQFSTRDDRIASTICGVSKPERIDQTFEWANWPIPEAAWEELQAIPKATDDPEATRVYDPG